MTKEQAIPEMDKQIVAAERELLSHFSDDKEIALAVLLRLDPYGWSLVPMETTVALAQYGFMKLVRLRLESK